jgi:ribosome maturation factor RimP
MIALITACFSVFGLVTPVNTLQAIIETTVEGLGFELVEFESSPRGRLLRVFIDKPWVPDIPDTDLTAMKGITIDDCTLVSNQLSRVFTVENVDYDRLEVSSPGLDRALTKPIHFHRFIGAELRLKLRAPLGNQRNFSGTIAGTSDASLRLLCDGQALDIPWGNIERARLSPQF